MNVKPIKPKTMTTQVTPQNFTEICIAAKLGIEGLVEYRKYKLLQAVKAFRAEQEKRNAIVEKVLERKIAIAALKAKIEKKALQVV